MLLLLLLLIHYHTTTANIFPNKRQLCRNYTVVVSDVTAVLVMIRGGSSTDEMMGRRSYFSDGHDS